MTREQREVLKANLDAEFPILTIEYPSHAKGRDDNLKVVTRGAGSDCIYVDFYAFDGATVEQSHYYAREAM